MMTCPPPIFWQGLANLFNGIGIAIAVYALLKGLAEIVRAFKEIEKNET